MCHQHDHDDAHQHHHDGAHHGHQGDNDQHNGAHHAHAAPAAPSGTSQEADLAECPVMPGSMSVKADAEAAGLVRDYEGQRYWLCCSSCGPLFDANPKQYARTA